MSTPSEDAAPFCEEPFISGSEGERLHFVGSEPAEFDAFWADFECRVFWGDKHPSDIVMFVLGFTGASGDGVDIEVEWARGGEDESLDARFFQGLALSDREHILVTVAMTSERKPFIELTMVVEKGLRAIRTDQHHAAGEMSWEGGSEEARLRRVEEGNHFGSERDFVGPFGQIEVFESGSQGGAGHLNARIGVGCVFIGGWRG